LPNLAIVTIGVALGFLQWFILQNRIRNSGWWIPATIIGWTLGSIIALIAAPEGLDVIAGLVIGATTGIAQWLVLRREVNWAGWWIVMNIVAWTTGLALLPGLILTVIMAGLITGFALILLLEYPKAEGFRPK
jgi:hypothetical protein